MPRNATTAGDAVAALVQSAAAGVTPGTPVTDAQLKAIWEAVATGFFTHDAANAAVAAGAFTNPAGAVTGVGGPIS